MIHHTRRWEWSICSNWRGSCIIERSTHVLDLEGSGFHLRSEVFNFDWQWATNNFIYAQIVRRREIPTDDFEGFSVLVPGDRTMQCMHYVPSLSITMGTYTLIYHFFVVDIPDTNVILGVQWLITFRKVTTDWENSQMEWVDRKSGKTQMIKYMHTYPSHTTST